MCPIKAQKSEKATQCCYKETATQAERRCSIWALVNLQRGASLNWKAEAEQPGGLAWHPEGSAALPTLALKS